MTEETPLEDFYVESISPNIRKFLSKRGFNVIPEEISRQKEKETPYDRLYNLGFKIFGLQFKRPKLEKGVVYWERDEVQHNTLKKFNWIFYTLPYFVNRQDYDNGLYLVKILDGKGFKNPRLYYQKKLGMDWGTFITEVFKCKLGLKIQDSQGYSYWPDKKEQKTKEFLGVLSDYQVKFKDEEKIMLKPGFSFLSLFTLDLEKKEYEKYDYIYPLEILKKFDKAE